MPWPKSQRSQGMVRVQTPLGKLEGHTQSWGHPAHIKAGPRVRNRTAVQRVAVFHSLGHHQTKDDTEAEIFPQRLPVACPASLGKSQKHWKQSFQPKWSIFTVAKPTGKNRTSDIETCFLNPPPHTPPLPIAAQPGRGSWDNTEQLYCSFWLQKCSAGNKKEIYSLLLTLHESGAPGPSQLEHKGDAHLLRE